MKRFWCLAFVSIFHMVVFLVIFQGVFPDEGDYAGYAEADSRSLYFMYADKIFHGELPYQDFDIEYTPLALPLFLLPRLFAESDIGYHVAFAVEMLLFDLAGLVMLWMISKRLGRSAVTMLIVYTIGLLALGPTIIDHFDLAAAVFLLAAVYAFMSQRCVTSAILLACGTMVKVFPIIILPIFAVYLIRRKRYQKLVKHMAAFGIVIVVVSLPCLLIDAGGYIDSFTYHSDRGLQAESTYASILLLGHEWGISTVKTDFMATSGSWDILTPTADRLATISPFMTVFLLAIVYGLYFLRERSAVQSYSEEIHKRMINFVLLTIGVFLIANKVFSPQYLIWLYPLIPLVSGRFRVIHWVIYVLAGMMTMYIFSYHYDYIFSDHYLDLVYHLETVPIYVLAARNLLLVVMAVLLIEWRSTARKAIPDENIDISEAENGRKN